MSIEPPETPPSSFPVPRPLEAIRREIDRIDETMHGLLIERGAVLGEVLAAKKAAGDHGSAFRPAREASLMRRLAERHRGLFPFDTAESIWRVILATSTYVQVPYAVHGDVSGGDAPMRESARFHFGFTVPFVPCADGPRVIAAVAASHGDLGVFRLDQGDAAGAWWRLLEGEAAPKIIARLPFLDRPDHPAGMPVFVIAPPDVEGLARETILASIVVERWTAAATQALGGVGARLTASAGLANGASLLVSHPADVSDEQLTRALEGAKCAPFRYRGIGCHAMHVPLPGAPAR